MARVKKAKLSSSQKKNLVIANDSPVRIEYLEITSAELPRTALESQVNLLKIVNGTVEASSADCPDVLGKTKDEALSVFPTTLVKSLFGIEHIRVFRPSMEARLTNRL